MIEPTNGRIVLYTPGPAERIAHVGKPLAAMIVNVLHPRLVNLVVFDSIGGVHARALTALKQDDDVISEGPFAEWMPYQKGQAAKTEQAEAILAAAAEGAVAELAAAARAAGRSGY